MPKKLQKEIVEIIKSKYPSLGARRTVWHLKKAGFNETTSLAVKSYAFRNGLRVKRNKISDAPAGNKRPKVHKIGHISMKHGDLYIKVAMPNVWEIYRRWFYRTLVGPIPEGYIVLANDGNKMNIVPENLRCVPKGYLLRTEEAQIKLHHRWQAKKEATKRKRRRVKLVNKYGSLSNALAMGEKL